MLLHDPTNHFNDSREVALGVEMAASYVEAQPTNKHRRAVANSRELRYRLRSGPLHPRGSGSGLVVCSA